MILDPRGKGEGIRLRGVFEKHFQSGKWVWVLLRMWWWPLRGGHKSMLI